MNSSFHRFVPVPAPKDLAERVRELQAETRELAADHVAELIRALGDVARLSGEIADGGEVYAVGARELSRRLAEDTRKHADTLTAIQGRQL